MNKHVSESNEVVLVRFPALLKSTENIVFLELVTNFEVRAKSEIHIENMFLGVKNTPEHE